MRSLTATRRPDPGAESFKIHVDIADKYPTSGWPPGLHAGRRGVWTCTLYGFPGVSALASGDHQLGSAAGRDHSDPTRLVTLGRGATAHAVLQITNVANFPPSSCGRTTAVALRVYPPGATRSLQIPFRFRACGKSGPVYLHVRTTVAGAGVPGFSG